MRNTCAVLILSQEGQTYLCSSLFWGMGNGERTFLRRGRVDIISRVFYEFRSVSLSVPQGSFNEP